jgi:hypothetical protein
MSEAFAAGFFRLASKEDGKACLVLAEDEEPEEEYEDEGYEEGESVEYDSLTPVKFCMYCGTQFEFEEAG